MPSSPCSCEAVSPTSGSHCSGAEVRVPRMARQVVHVLHPVRAGTPSIRSCGSLLSPAASVCVLHRDPSRPDPTRPDPPADLSVASTPHIVASTLYIVASTLCIVAPTPHIVASTPHIVASTLYIVAFTLCIVAPTPHIVAPTRCIVLRSQALLSANARLSLAAVCGCTARGLR